MLAFLARGSARTFQKNAFFLQSVSSTHKCRGIYAYHPEFPPIPCAAASTSSDGCNSFLIPATDQSPHLQMASAQVLAVFRSFPFRAPAVGTGAEETQAPPPSYNSLVREPEEAGEIIPAQGDPENVGEDGGGHSAVRGGVGWSGDRVGRSGVEWNGVKWGVIGVRFLFCLKIARFY